MSAAPLVLIVDDEDSYLEVLSDVLSMAGHRCIRAHDGREALDAIRERRPDLVVTDHMMPRMTGVELLRELRADKELASLPTVLVSAIKPNGANLATRYLQKPIHVDAIQRTIAELVEAPGNASTRNGETANHMQTREEALNWIAHEIKNPLGVAVINAELLLQHAHDDFERRHLTTLKRQLKRMDELVMSVLEAARLDDGRVILHRAPVEMVGFVDSIVEDWRTSHPDHTFEVRAPATPIECRIDSERVRQILDNLISNAVKYGGTDRRVVIAITTHDRELRVSVADYGKGIAQQDLQRIFDRFHRAEHGGRGHGLGLYIAAALARLHGGAISVESKVGAGSTFRLTLPLSDQSGVS